MTDKKNTGELVTVDDSANLPTVNDTNSYLTHVSILDAKIEKIRWENIHSAIDAHNRAGQAQMRSNEILAELKESEILRDYAIERARNKRQFINHQNTLDQIERDNAHKNLNYESKILELENQIKIAQLEGQLSDVQQDTALRQSGESPAQKVTATDEITRNIKQAYDASRLILKEAKENGAYTDEMQEAQDKVLELKIASILSGGSS